MAVIVEIMNWDKKHEAKKALGIWEWLIFLLDFLRFY